MATCQANDSLMTKDSRLVAVLRRRKTATPRRLDRTTIMALAGGAWQSDSGHRGLDRLGGALHLHAGRISRWPPQPYIPADNRTPTTSALATEHRGFPPSRAAASRRLPPRPAVDDPTADPFLAELSLRIVPVRRTAFPYAEPGSARSAACRRWGAGPRTQPRGAALRHRGRARRPALSGQQGEALLGLCGAAASRMRAVVVRLVPSRSTPAARR